MKKRDGIAEILASGRCPGFIVRGGSTSKPLEVAYGGGVDGSEADPRRRRAIDAEIWREKKAAVEEKKSRHRMARKVDGAIRHVASVPFEVEQSLKKKYGADYSGQNKMNLLKREGFAFEK